MEKCHSLRDYMLFVSKIREYRKEMPLPRAMEEAVTECIKNDILAQFLRKNRAEVIKVGIYEYDEELHMHQVWEDAKEEGIKEGIGISVENLMENMGWSEEQAWEALKAPEKRVFIKE